MSFSPPRPADAPDLSAFKRVLITKLRHHGDVLLASPVFHVLKQHAPHLELDALVYSDTVEMLEGHPAIAQIHRVDRLWKDAGLTTQVPEELALARILNERAYDMVIHLSEHPRGARLARMKSVKVSVGPEGYKARGLSKFGGTPAFSHFYKLPRRGNARHMVEVNLDALRRIGIQPAEDARQLRLSIGKAEEGHLARLFGQHGLIPKQFLHLHPASRWFFKCWTVDGNAALIDKLVVAGHQVVLTAAPSEAELKFVAAIIERCKSKPLSLAGQLSLKQLAALSGAARLFIGVDSAPMHIAAAMQTPTVALFGPSGEIEWGPWQVASRVVTSAHTCRPCGHDGCGGGKISECLTTLPVSQVFDAVQALLNATAPTV